jgi:hypothetical protein
MAAVAAALTFPLLILDSRAALAEDNTKRNLVSVTHLAAHSFPASPESRYPADVQIQTPLREWQQKVTHDPAEFNGGMYLHARSMRATSVPDFSFAYR